MFWPYFLPSFYCFLVMPLVILKHQKVIILNSPRWGGRFLNMGIWGWICFFLISLLFYLCLLVIFFILWSDKKYSFWIQKREALKILDWEGDTNIFAVFVCVFAFVPWRSYLLFWINRYYSKKVNLNWSESILTENDDIFMVFNKKFSVQ